MDACPADLRESEEIAGHYRTRERQNCDQLNRKCSKYQPLSAGVFIEQAHFASSGRWRNSRIEQAKPLNSSSVGDGGKAGYASSLNASAAATIIMKPVLS